ncbi:MAG: hypothetical protein E7521_01840 [Ruminococcaceae bacterium]|nr:hypothetical protein [Oscillospiraceae bacterium]
MFYSCSDKYHLSTYCCVLQPQQHVDLLFLLPQALQPDGQPMHFAPFFLALMIYIMAAAKITTITANAI